MTKESQAHNNIISRIISCGGWLGVMIIFCIIVFIFAIGNSDPNSSSIKTTNNTSSSSPQSAEVIKKDYDLMYSARTRFDGAQTYYILVPEQDLSNANFKKEIEKIIRDFVAEKGSKLSIEIHDNINSLEISYQQYGTKTLNRLRTAQEDKMQSRHYIASFSGELSSGIYYNTLYWFPGAFNNTPETGSYVDIIEFNPLQ